MTEKIVVFSNCGSEEDAMRVARTLVGARVAACVNILPKVRSVYRWKGAIEEESEWACPPETPPAFFRRMRIDLQPIRNRGAHFRRSGAHVAFRLVCRMSTRERPGEIESVDSSRHSNQEEAPA